MTIKFPQQIDSFSIKSPNEIVQSAHVNDLQDVIVAIEVFAKSLEQSLDNHLEAGSAHTSLEIAVAAIAGLDTTNLQTTLESLKSTLELAIANLEVSTELDLISHRDLDIDLAHPNGTFPGSRITNSSITGSKIQAGAITIDKLGFDLATQVELDNHANTNIAEAHPNGTFPIARLDVNVATQADLGNHSSTNIATAHPNGLFPIARLDVDVATQAELDNHTQASSDVHGVGSGSAIVGTSTAQTLENKKIVSRFEGTKALFFKESVLDVEVALYNSMLATASQFEIRERSVWTVTEVDHSGIKSVITLESSDQFSDLVGLPGQVEFFSSAVGVRISTTIESATGNQLTLSTNEPQILAGWFAQNLKKSTPYFSVGNGGQIKIKELEIENGLSNITINEDLDVAGNLLVVGNGELDGSLTVDGTLTSLGNLSAPGLLTSLGQTTITSTLLSAKNLTLANNLQVQQNITANGNQILAGNLNVGGNERVDGYLSVGKYASIADSLFVGGALTVVAGIQAKELDIIGDTRLQGGFHAEGYSSIDDNLYVNGDVTITGQIYVAGLGNVVGPAISTDNALARYDGYTGTLIQDSPATLDDSGLLSVPNLDSHGVVLTTLDGYDSLLINKSGLGYALKIENLLDAYTSPFVVDSYGYVGLGSLTPTRRLEVIGDSYFSDQLKPVKGSVSLPIYSFNGDSDVGMWSSAANNLDFAVNGINQLNINTSSVVVTNDLRIDGGDLETTSASFNLLNSVSSLTLGTNPGTVNYNLATGATSSGNSKTINLGSGGQSGSTTSINIGSANGSTTTILGDLIVSGTTTQLNVTNLEVQDNNIRLNKGGLDASAANAGLSIEGTGTSTLANLLYDSGLASRFKIGLDGYESEILTSSTLQTIAGSKTFSSSVSISPTSNQLVLGTTNTTTIDAFPPASSRIYTILDVGADAYFLMTEGNQTINGTKTFESPTIFNDTGLMTVNSATAGLRIVQSGAGPSLQADGYILSNFFTSNSETLTIASSAISVTRGLGVIVGGDGYSLDTVNGMSNGQQVVLINNTGNLITVTNSGNISTGTGRDFRFANTSAAILVFSSATNKAQLLGGGNGGDVWETKATSGAIVASVKYFASTVGGPITLTFPSSPQLGDTIVISDPTGSWDSTNSVTLNGNGKTIAGQATLTLTTADKTYTLVYYDLGNNWTILRAPTSYGG